MSKEIPPCARLAAPIPRSYDAYIDNDDILDKYTVPPDDSERSVEIDCDEINKRKSCVMDFETPVDFSRYNPKKMCEDKEGIVEVPAKPRLTLSPSMSSLFLGRKFDLSIFSSLPRDATVNGKPLNEVTLSNSAGEKLKHGTWVKHLTSNPNGLKLEATLTPYISFSAGFNFNDGKFVREWDGPWVITGFKVVGFTSDPERKKTDDLSPKPDEKRKYAVVHALLSSTKPADYEMVQSSSFSFGFCFCCEKKLIPMPVYAHREAPLDELSTKNLSPEPPDVPEPVAKSQSQEPSCIPGRPGMPWAPGITIRIPFYGMFFEIYNDGNSHMTSIGIEPKLWKLE